MKIRQWLAPLALLGSLALAQAGLGDTPDKPLVIGYQAGAATLDPIMRAENVSYVWQRHIFDTLTYKDRDGQAKPRILTDWKAVGTNEWVMGVRQGVRYHNGDPLTAEDVAASILDAANNPKSQVRHFLVAVKDVKVVDARTIRILTGNPDPNLPLGLTQIPAMPQAYIQKVGRDAFAKNPVGSGPYRFVKWLAQESLDLEAFAGYWGKQPEFKHVRITVIPNAATRVAALLSGQIQVAHDVDPQDIPRVKGSGRTYVTSTTGFRTIYLAMDYYRTKDSPGMPAGQANPFMNPLVRKALYQAIDAEAIVNKFLEGMGTVATQFLPPTAEAYDPAARRLPYDPKAARALLAQAGYPNGFKVRLETNTDRALLAQALAGLLGQVGIQAEVNAVPTAVFNPNLNKGEFTLFLNGWGTTDAVATYNALFRCIDTKEGLGASNRIKYCNATADKFIVQSSAAFDETKRNNLSRSAYRVAERTDFAYIPIYYQSAINGVANGVGWTARPDEMIFAWDMTRK